MIGAVILALLAASPPRKVAVVPVVLAEPNADVSEVSVVADVGEVLRYRGALSAIPQEALAEGLKSCGADTLCVTERLAAEEVTLGLLVLVNARLSPPFVSVQLLDVLERRTIAQARGPTSDAVGAEVRARVTRVLGEAGYAESGRLLVEVVPAGSTVEVSPAGVSGDTQVLAPGPYTVRARHEGYLSGEQTVVVEAGRDTRASLVLEPRGSVLSSPWLWVAVIAAAAGGATAAILVASRPDPSICITVTQIGCP